MSTDTEKLITTRESKDSAGSTGGFDVFSRNMYIGQFVMEIDGDYYWYPNKENYFGCWGEEVLRGIILSLSNLNETAPKYENPSNAHNQNNNNTEQFDISV